MHKDLTKELESSFLSCEKDVELILKKLFVDARPYSNILKKLLVINTKDCLVKAGDHANEYDKIIEDFPLSKLRENGYIRLEPKIFFEEHEEVKSYILLSFDDFTMNEENPQFRDCTVNFDIICHTDYWDIGDYRMRPLKIAGYIDGILNNNKLTGIGRFIFSGCHELILNENLSGYTISYRAIHGSDDLIEPEEE